MRPIRLMMTAFGPYKDKETIDFGALNGHRLFLISGNTGAGKTSIFDAICFALYGEASGSDRNEAVMLRSQFADDDVHTSVEFEFELKQRTYRIFRQLPHVKAGNKTATGERYEFVETTGGRETMMVDRNHVRQINERIVRLIGLTKDQFSQIVMLPQGEFRKLLTSDTENKEQILRKIFRTHLYRLVAESLNNRRKAAQAEWELARRELEAQMYNLRMALQDREHSPLQMLFAQEHYNTVQVLEALDAETADRRQELAACERRLGAQTQQLKSLVEQFHHASRLSSLFDAQDAKQRELAALESRAGEVDGWRRRLALAEKSLPIQVRERHVEAAKADLRLQEQRVREAEAARRQAAADYEQAGARYRAEEGRAHERERLVREQERLSRIMPTVQALEAGKMRLEQLRDEASALERQWRKIEEEAATGLEENRLLAAQIRELESRTRQLPPLIEQRARMREDAALVRECLRLDQAIAAQRESVSLLHAQYRQAAEACALLESRWLEGQAGLLAGHLLDGAPCPVCGSVDHPRKAVQIADMPDKAALDRSRGDRAERESAYLAGQAKLAQMEQERQAKSREAAARGFDVQALESAYAALVESGKAIHAEIQRLESDQSALIELQAKLAQLEQRLDLLLAEKEAKAAQYRDREKAWLTEQARYGQALADVPDDLRDLAGLKRRMDETEAEKTRLETAWRQVQEQLRQTGERHAAAVAHAAAAAKQMADSANRLAEAESEFDQALQAAEFESERAYAQAKLPEPERAALKADIEAYDAQLAAIRNQLAELNAALEGQTRPDLDVLKEEIDRMEVQVEEARSALQQAQDGLDKALAGRDAILKADRRLQETERAYVLVKDLYDVVRGENRFKISLERYLLAEFLDRILQAANLRLRTISGGQFYLARSDRREKHGKQSGLGLDVYDNYTGQFRDVKSLSGGEKFNASLCLALGMADVIQAHEGGISLETMFIDEGFGSLDEEALNKAIETLVQLQATGRMIGIISHVQELKQVIPAVLEVRKSAEGHSYTRFRVG
jgi:exonuclease SbcC